MTEKNDKLLIKIGQNFEANATGRLAIAVVLIVFGIFAYGAFLG